MEKYLILITVLFYIIVTITMKYQTKMTLKDLDNNKEKFLIYLDKFFVKNLSSTILNVFCYIIFHILTILLIRISFTKYIIKTPDTFTTIQENLLQIIFNIILLFLIILLLKILLNKIFFNSLLKLHIYLKNNDLYLQWLHIIHPYYFVNFFGKCYLFFYNIIKGQTLRDLNDLKDYKDIDQYETIYENIYIRKLSDKIIYWNKRFIILFFINMLLKNIFKWLYLHMNLQGFIPYIPKIIFVFLIVYDFSFYKIYFNYIFCIYYLITIFIEYLCFIKSKDPLADHYISHYFYDKKLNYKTQRIYLIKDFQFFMQYIIKNKDENVNLNYILNLSNIQYVVNDFIQIWSKDTEDITKSLKSLYRRYFMIILFIMLIYYYYKNEIYNVNLIQNNIKFPFIFMLLLLIFIIIFISKKTYILTDLNNGDDSDCYCYYKHRKSYNILFWVITFISISIISYLLIKSNIIINDIIFDSSYIKVIKYYTIEEKIAIFYNKFDLYVKHYAITDPHLYHLTLLIKELQIEYFIFEDTTFKEIDLLINNFFDYYIKEIKNINSKNNYPWMDDIKNLIISYSLYMVIAENLAYFLYYNKKYLTNKDNLIFKSIIKFIYYLFFNK